MNVKLQVPIDKNVRDRLEQRARDLGFDSIQAYIRVWAKAEADGRKLDFDGGAVTLSSEATERYTQMVDKMDEESKAGKLKEFKTIDEFMADLRA